MPPSALVIPRGRTTPRAFFAAGVALFVAKFVLDNAVARLLGRPWSLIEYLAPGQSLASLLTDRPDRAFYLTMTAAALPFIVAGLALTVRRLRDAALPMWLVALFFVPLANLFFFLVLCFVPPARGEVGPRSLRSRLIEEGAPPAPEPAEFPAVSEVPPPVLDYSHDPEPALFPRVPLLRRWPVDAGPSSALAALLPAPLMAVIVLFGSHVLLRYGWGLFIGLPFVNGMLCALLHGAGRPRTVQQSMGVAACGVLASAAAVLLFAIEGLGCMIMFLPLAVPVGLLGAGLGHAIQNRPSPERYRTWRAGCSVLALLPLIMSAERGVAPPAPLFAVTTTVDVDAPPDVVWRNVVSFPDLPAPTTGSSGSASLTRSAPGSTETAPARSAAASSRPARSSNQSRPGSPAAC